MSLLQFMSCFVISSSEEDLELKRGCLNKFLESENMTFDPIYNQTEGCDQYIDAIRHNIDELYENLQKHLIKATNEEELICLMHSFRQFKIFESTIMLTSAYQKPEKLPKKKIDELVNSIQQMSKIALVFTAIKCSITDEMLIDFMFEISEILQVKNNSQELSCLYNYLIDNSFMNETIFTSNVTEIEPTESIDCENYVTTTCDRIKKISFKSFTNTEKECLRDTIEIDDCNYVMEFMVMRMISITEVQHEYTENKGKKLLFNFLIRFVDCADTLSFFKNADIFE